MILDKKIYPTEYQEQRKIIEWSKIKKFKDMSIYQYLIVSQNGMHVFSKKSINILKLSGFRCGIPDMFIAIPIYPYHGMFLELKRIKGYKISKDLLNIVSILKSCNYKCEIAFGADDAINKIESYINL